MGKFKRLLFFAGIVILLVAVLSIRPVPVPAEGNYDTLTAQLSSVEEIGGPDDIFLSLKGEERHFYINRGAKVLDVDLLRTKATDQVVTLYYSNHWTPLDPSGSTRHIYALEVEGERIYDEFK